MRWRIHNCAEHRPLVECEIDAEGLYPRGSD